MTDNTQPEAREFTMSQYASKDDMIGAMRKRIAELESELEAVGAGGVQALIAAPEAFLISVIALCTNRGCSPENIEAWDKDDKWIADLWRQAETMLAASPTPPAEQQAAPKAAPVKACVCGEPQAPGTVHRVDGPCYVAAPQQEAQADSQSVPVVDKCTKQQITAEVLRRMQQQEDGHNRNPFRSLLDRLMRNEGGYSTIEIGQLKYALDGFYGAASAPADSVTAPAATVIKKGADRQWMSERLGHLPDGIYSLYLAPQQEAQEPVAYIHVPHHTVEGKVRPVVSFEKYQQDYADGIYSTRIPLYAAPKPAPAPLSDDTERLEWLLWKLPGDALRYVVGELSDTSSGAEFRAAIDTAIAAQGGKA